MASVSEILDNFNSGLYKTKDELENALQKIHEHVALVSDSIDDFNERMIDTLNRFKKRRFCTYCEVYYSLVDLITHENTNLQRRNITNQKGREIVEVESAINSRLKTFWIVSEEEEGQDVVSFLNENRDELIDKVKEQVITINAIKFNLVLICKFKKGENDEYDASFKTSNIRVLLADQIHEIVDKSFSKLLKEKSEFQAKGSGWVLSKVLGLELRINKYIPLRGSTYIELPARIKNIKAVINVNHSDLYCFKYAIWAKNIGKDSQRVSKYNTRSFHEGYKWDCIEYPVDIKDIVKFERINNISINVFGLDEKNMVYPIKIVDSELDDHRDLLYITNDKTSHYCWIKDFEKLVRSQITKHHCVYASVVLPAIRTKSIQNCVKERAHPVKLCCQMIRIKLPFVVYADFECLLQNVSTCEPSSHTSYTYVIQRHEPFSFCYVVITPDSCQSPQLYRGPNAVRIFIERMKDEAEKIYTLYKNSIPMNPLTAEEETTFHLTSLCHTHTALIEI
ncbi:hypothetical protein J437_LFUL018111 [Ladona fulva]|uniref:Uncharacterized protein n=1 Tax=Ladona fulva TaxID=123851 RepID=A0A8K0PEH2_LADFU|nr:hypothetical protein J437_LFUL018111 [Ladona fulva]